MAKSGNVNLHVSRADKTDEFYTDMSLIQDELSHYVEFFCGKTVFCNADDPYESNFFKFFAMQFNTLGLNKLIATGYVNSPIAGEEFPYYIKPGLEPQLCFPFDEASDLAQVPPRGKRPPYRAVLVELTDINGDGAVDLEDVRELVRRNARPLDSDGDFRSPESVELLKQADVVVTNPPFSLFREYMAQLIAYDKKFLIVGNQNAITYREILPLIVGNKIWLGYNNGHFWFRVPDYYEEKRTDFKIDETGQKWRRMGNICWFTNIDIKKRHEDLILFKRYSKEEFPRYDNYDAIDVKRTADIPVDYPGVMGVPITFIQYHNPEQFEILGDTRYHDGQDFSDDINFINGKGLYRRILIRHRNPEV